MDRELMMRYLKQHETRLNKEMGAILSKFIENQDFYIKNNYMPLSFFTAVLALYHETKRTYKERLGATDDQLKDLEEYLESCLVERRVQQNGK